MTTHSRSFQLTTYLKVSRETQSLRVATLLSVYRHPVRVTGSLPRIFIFVYISLVWLTSIAVGSWELFSHTFYFVLSASRAVYLFLWEVGSELHFRIFFSWYWRDCALGRIRCSRFTELYRSVCEMLIQILYGWFLSERLCWKNGGISSNCLAGPLRPCAFSVQCVFMQHGLR